MNSQWIVSNRPDRNATDFTRPYHWMVEKERNSYGQIKDTGIIFLTNKECSFHCLMCDLWKNTTKDPVPLGAIPEQISWALGKMSGVKQIKLYNSGSFFDVKAIPVEDHVPIASLVGDYETVIVEAHPKIIDEKCLRFNDMLQAELEVAIGLETVHPEILQKLNKSMTVSDFEKAVKYLTSNNIRSRAFILLRTPFMSEKEGITWAKRSIDLAFEAGVDCCTVIPVRPGNGAMDVLMRRGEFEKPSLESLEEVLDYGVALGAGRVYADTWDLEQFSTCAECFRDRFDRLTKINLDQSIPDRVKCQCNAV